MRRWPAWSALALFACNVWADAPALIEAVESKRSESAYELIREGVDVNLAAPDGTTALMWAAHHGDVELARRLIEAGANASLVNEYGASAISQAATIGNARIIRLLLDAGVDADSSNPHGETALMAVARTGNVEAARLLLEAGADINATEDWGGQSALMWATAQLQPQMVEFLVEQGADVNARGAVRNWQRRITAEPRPKDMNKGGFTPLLYAVRGGCLECARHLISGGADIDLADPDGVTPLILAIITWNFDVARYLISSGANVDRWDLFGRTPLYAAIDMNTLPFPDRPGKPSLASLGLARMLLERGANPNPQLKLRRPPFRNAIGERGADNTLTTGATPLLRAAHASDNDAIRLLLEHGALVDLPNAAGITPLLATAGLGLSPRSNRGRFKTEKAGIESARLLLAAGADINKQVDDPRRLEHEPDRDLGGAVRYNSVHMPPDGQTALHGAARRGWNDMITFLVEHGAKMQVRDVDGKTPLDMAMGNYEPEPLDPPHEALTETVSLLEDLCSRADYCRVDQLASSRPN